MVTTTLPHVLGTPASLTLGKHIGSLWSVGIDGRGYILSTLDQESPFEYRAYTVMAIPIEKPRLDDADEPGEQTLFPWWTRAQHSWHEGAGQDVFDSPFSTRFGFRSSKGIDIWEDGKITLLHDTAQLRADNNVTDHFLLGGDDALFYTHDGNIVKDPISSAETTIATHAGTPVNSITSDGETLYLAYSGVTLGIKGINMSSFSATAQVNLQTDVDLIGFVKGRLIGAKANELFDYDLSSTTAPGSAHYTDEASNFKFTGITEIGPGILVSGYAGERSEIMILRLTAQDISSGLTLGVPRNVWTAPEGEQIHSIRGYLGNSVIIGTSKGLRIGVVSTGEGDLEVSPLVVETDHPVLALEPQGDYCWFGWTKFDATSSGLGRIHLGDLAYASDLMFDIQEDVYSIAEFGGLLYYSTNDGTNSRIISEESATLVSSGNFLTGEIRFGTTERKEIRFFDLLSRGLGKWSMALSVDGAAFTDFVTDIEQGYSDEVVNASGTRFEVKVTLSRDASDDTEGPEVEEWRLRSEPKATGRFRYIVPVMLYDRVQTLNGKSVGYAGKGWEDLEYLMDIYREDRSFIFQSPAAGIPGTSGTSKEVKLEDLQFKSYSPPQGFKGFGGIGLLVMRDLR